MLKARTKTRGADRRSPAFAPLRPTLGLAALLLAGMAGLAQARDSVVLQLDWIASGEKSASVAGAALGYFADEGIDVEIRQGTGAQDSLTKVATGVADFGYCDISNVMLTRSQGALAKAIYAIDVMAPHAIITRADTGIKAFRDLPGHSVGTAPTASSNLFFPLVLEDAKIDASTIKMINAEPGVLGPMLLSKRIDAAMIWVTNEPVLKGPARDAGVELVVIPFSNEGMNMYSSVIIASDKTLAQKPDLARRFVRAIKRSYLFMRDHPAEVADLLVKAHPEQNAKLVTDALTLANRELIFRPGVTEANIGTFDDKLMGDTHRWLARAQNFDAKQPRSLFVDQRFISGGKS